MPGNSGFEVRRYQAGDAEQVAQLFFDTVRTVNLAHYSEDQVRAWAPEVNPERWHEKMSSSYGIVAADGDNVLGFSNLTEDGYLDCLFVHRDAQRRGVGKALMAEIESAARSLGLERLTSDVSHNAKPIFEAQGYTVVTPQRVEKRGQVLENFKMELRL